MKKVLLLILVFGIGYTANAQLKHELRSTKAPTAKLLMEPVPQGTSSIFDSELPETIQGDIKGRAATFVPMGQAGNAYGLYANPRTYLWADPNLNSVVFTHRMIGGVEVDGNSRVSYDVSTDGGASWATNVHVYSPLGPGPQYPDAGGRYPQGAIINPFGNTDPANAFYTYFICTLDQTNGGSWGGYGYGSNPLTETDPPNPSQVNLTTEDGYFRLIPDAFTVTTGGVSWYADPSTDYTSGAAEYTGEVILGRGEMVDGEVAYEESLFELLDPLEGFNDTKMAFGPDGLTGYMVFMTSADSDPVPYTNYHPVLLKTIDGGDTWSDPIQVQFGGVDGIESLKYYWSDEILESIDAYGPGFNRDEVYYNMGFSVDVIVDSEGNPHITGIIAIGTEDGWFPGEGTMATWHIFSDDGGSTWDATALYDNLFFEGDIGGLGMWNRPYASSTYDGHYLFFSWIDTDLDGAEGNTNPNIFVVGYDSEDHIYTEVENVTELSLYWFSAFYGSASQYVFASEAGDVWQCEIPFMFTEYTVPGDPASEMNFYYVDGYTMDMPVGVDNVEGAIDFSVAQNSPNPAVNNTSVLVTSETPGVINLRISNVLGQVVHTQSVNNSALAHTFNFDVSNFDSGIYFYTIEIGNKAVTKKMLVK